MVVKENISETLSFYSALGRPLTALEIWRMTPAAARPKTIFHLTEKLETDSRLENKNGFFSFKLRADRRRQDLLLDEKWKKFLPAGRWFSFIPFIDFVFAAGSLALGTVHPVSDFDVLIGCHAGRIFTVRFLSLIVFSLLGIRRKRLDHQTAASNKICLNHFVTPAGYQLQPPYNLYWRSLYKNLVPVWGNVEAMKNFLNANQTIAGPNFLLYDLRRRQPSFNPIKTLLAFIFQGRLGDLIEKILKKIQITRIENNLKRENIDFSRLIYNDKTLEFHRLWNVRQLKAGSKS